jgi:UMP-CMP kinase
MPPIDPTSGTDPTLQPSAPTSTSTNTTPTFDPQKVTVVYLLGGPGSGKGTQSAHLVRDYGFTHMSAGDLLRAEQDRGGSEYGQLIKDYIKNGEIVPMEVTVKLLENAMRAELDKKESGARGRFLIDGFPRKMDQAIFFEDSVCPSRCTLFLDCPEDVMRERLLNRGKTSGRSDDNAESIKKRFKTFVETSMPVVDYFEKQKKVVKVSAAESEGKVYEGVVKGLGDMGIYPEK